MIDKIERLLLKWVRATPKQTYLKLLSQFEKHDATINQIPLMLVEFWRKVDVNDFADGPSFRDMMYVNFRARHKTISDLYGLLIRATANIAQDDTDALNEISVNEFATYHEMTLDDYFAGVNGGSVNYFNGVSELKRLMLAHGEVIENLTNGYHCRVLNRMYNDILTVTVTIIENMKD